MSNNAAVNKWISNNYDLINAYIPHSALDSIHSAAKANGESVNAYIVGSVFSYLGLPIPASKPRFSPTSACAVCGNPLPEGKARYCSDKCKTEARRCANRERMRRVLASQKQRISED